MRFVWLPLLLSLGGLAQKKNIVIRYLDEQLRLTSAKHAVYRAISIQDHGRWWLHAVYEDSTPMIDASFLDKKLEILDGRYTFYFPNKRKSQEGSYKANLLDGIWKQWYSNGQLKDSIVEVNGLVSGVWTRWNVDGTLSSMTTYTNQLTDRQKLSLAIYLSTHNKRFFGVKQGKAQTWYPNGALESDGAYADDNPVGEWRWYYSNGKPSTVEIYTEGKLDSLRCFDSTGKETGNACSVSKPATLKKYGSYKHYIEDHLVWPRDALKKHLEGEVTVHLEVNKQGRLTQLEITSDQQTFKDAIAKLFESMQAWEPAISHNRPVDWQDEMVIPFRRRD